MVDSALTGSLCGPGHQPAQRPETGGPPDRPASDSAITELLQRVHAGSEAARAELFQALYADLRRRAESLMRGQPAEHTLQPTALVNEALIRFLGENAGPWNDRRHFILTASRAMGQVLIDHARAKRRRKREGERLSLPMDEIAIEFEDRALDLEQLTVALENLEQVRPDLARLVDLRFFAGLGVAEAASVLEISLRTCERRWRTTRSWLYHRLR